MKKKQMLVKKYDYPIEKFFQTHGEITPSFRHLYQAIMLPVHIIQLCFSQKIRILQLFLIYDVKKDNLLLDL